MTAAHDTQRLPAIRGFSLLEVLVALLVLALGMGAVVHTAGQQANLLRQAREHSYAQWVASNVLAEARLARNLPRTGLREGQMLMGSQTWHWRMQITDTSVAGIQRLDVSVFAPQARSPVLMLSGFSGP